MLRKRRIMASEKDRTIDDLMLRWEKDNQWRGAGWKFFFVIFAGAYQSRYKTLIDARANFASSPRRVFIRIFDPVLVIKKLPSHPLKMWSPPMKWLEAPLPAAMALVASKPGASSV